MDKKYLQENILSKPYNREVWYLVLKEIFGIKVLNEPVKELNGILHDPNQIVNNAYELGHFYTSDERLIGVYEIELKNDTKTKLASNKVGLRNLLRSVYKYDVDGALIIFKLGLKWRFSYVSEIRTIDGSKETEPKRYTYLFGDGESCRTAAERFIKLQNKPYYLADIYDAFSVEKLNEDFFKTYKDFFEKFSGHLANDSNYRNLLLGPGIKLSNGWKDNEAKPIRDFAKKLLGRLVFLQFLQKKGWLAVPSANKDWTGGDLSFLQNLFDSNDNKTTFHSGPLKRLFFETLNRKRDDDIAPEILGSNIKIPYLNGGLFDKDVSFENNIDFPDQLFKDLLDFFEHYNFTIDENDPYDNEVGIDPEMLGHIFENLLEENREKGAFYTPKEIVHFMCQESLIDYLSVQMPNYERNDFDLLVRSNKVSDKFTKYQIAQEINEKLKKVRICDPAIGSGAFPMGLLKEIFECRRVLYGYLKTNEQFNPANIKKEIIQNNIYGVDLENGAVDIARLRFWLSLVVDELIPQALPNLDYKIMQGNSLLESFGNTDLSNLTEIQDNDAFYVSKDSQLEIGVDFTLKQQSSLVFDHASKEKLYELIADYYNYDEATNTKYDNKKSIKKEINDIVEGKLLIKFISQKRKVVDSLKYYNSQLVANKSFSTDTSGLLQKKLRFEASVIKEIDNLNSSLKNIDDSIEHLHDLQSSINKPYFLWHLWFKEVFSEKGFDIVIGNPPYIQLQKLGIEADLLEKAKFKTFTRTGDIYCLFFELGVQLLKPSGNLIFITSNSWLRTNYGKLLRNYFNELTNPKILIDLSDSDIFRSATVRTSIFQLRKENNNNSLKAIRLDKRSQPFVKELNSFFNNNFVHLKNPGEGAWTVNEKEKADIIEMVRFKGKPLKKWHVEINRGLITGLNEAFIINEETRRSLIDEDPFSKSLIAKILRGKDIGKFQVFWEGYYVLLIKFGLHKSIEDFPAILKWLTKHESALRARGQCNTSRGSKRDSSVPIGDGGQHNWLELDNNPTQDLFNLFLNPKILYPGMVKNISFTYDDTGLFVNDKGFILSGEKLKYLLGVLNSKLFRYCFEEDFPELQGNSREIKAFVMKEIPIKYPNSIEENIISFLVNNILFLYDDENEALLSHTPNIRVAATFEEVLNMAVYELYFTDHMKENEIDVFAFLTKFANEVTEFTSKSILSFYLWLQQPDNPIRNRIIAVDIKSESFLSKINAATQ